MRFVRGARRKLLSASAESGRRGCLAVEKLPAPDSRRGSKPPLDGSAQGKAQSGSRLLQRDRSLGQVAIREDSPHSPLRGWLAAKPPGRSAPGVGPEANLKGRENREGEGETRRSVCLRLLTWAAALRRSSAGQQRGAGPCKVLLPPNGRLEVEFCTGPAQRKDGVPGRFPPPRLSRFLPEAEEAGRESEGGGENLAHRFRVRVAIPGI